MTLISLSTFHGELQPFVATWRPAGGVTRVVIVREGRGWGPLFRTGPGASPESALEAVAGRGAIEETLEGVKGVRGAQQQQVRSRDASEGRFDLCLLMRAGGGVGVGPAGRRAGGPARLPLGRRAPQGVPRGQA